MRDRHRLSNLSSVYEGLEQHQQSRYDGTLRSCAVQTVRRETNDSGYWATRSSRHP